MLEQLALLILFLTVITLWMASVIGAIWFVMNIEKVQAWLRRQDDPVRVAAYVLLGLSALIGVMGYFELLPLPMKVIEDFYANGAAELASIAITVLIVDRLSEWRAERREKEQILSQISSNSNQFALEAIREAQNRGWLYNGTLQGITITRADLSGVNLFQADLAESIFYRANLSKSDMALADFRDAYIRSVSMKDSDLRHVNFVNTYLSRVQFDGSNLRDSQFTGAYLRRVSFLNTNLDGVDFTGVRYTSLMEWPEGFDPIEAGAEMVPDNKEHDRHTKRVRHLNTVSEQRMVLK